MLTLNMIWGSTITVSCEYNNIHTVVKSYEDRGLEVESWTYERS
jgi:hypothetical protein